MLVRTHKELEVDYQYNHSSDVIMSAMASQITGVSIVCSVVYSGADPRKRITGLCEGNPVTGGFPSQRATNVENVSIWWRHNGLQISWHLTALPTKRQGTNHNFRKRHAFSDESLTFNDEMFRLSSRWSQDIIQNNQRDGYRGTSRIFDILHSSSHTFSLVTENNTVAPQILIMGLRW